MIEDGGANLFLLVLPFLSFSAGYTSSCQEEGMYNSLY